MKYMTLGDACYIFKNINSSAYTEDEKFRAIQQVIDMATHNSITKTDMMDVILWFMSRRGKA